MEDYIEMIYRTKKENLSITELADLLNIKVSSVSKMIIKLKKLDLVFYEKYGEIKLTKNGKVLGEYLLKRHNILLKFFNKINMKDNSYLVEQIEHFFQKDLIEDISKIIDNT